MCCVTDCRCRWISQFPCEELTLFYSLTAACLLVAGQVQPSWSLWVQEGERIYDGFFDLGCNVWQCERQRHFVSTTKGICSEYSEYVGCTAIEACQGFAVIATACAAAPVLLLAVNCVNKRAPASAQDEYCASPMLKFRLTKICTLVGGFCSILASLLWLLVQADLNDWLKMFRSRVAPPPLAGATKLYFDGKMTTGPAWLMVLFAGLMMWASALFAHFMPKMCRHVVFAGEGLPEAPRPPPPNRFYLDGITLGRQRVTPAQSVDVAAGAYGKDDVRRNVDAMMA